MNWRHRLGNCALTGNRASEPWLWANGHMLLQLNTGERWRTAEHIKSGAFKISSEEKQHLIMKMIKNKNSI
jgi:hypothetical protein